MLTEAYLYAKILALCKAEEIASHLPTKVVRSNILPQCVCVSIYGLQFSATYLFFYGGEFALKNFRSTNRSGIKRSELSTKTA